MTHITCKPTDDPTLDNRVWATFTFFTEICTDSPASYRQAGLGLELGLLSVLEIISLLVLVTVSAAGRK